MVSVLLHIATGLLTAAVMCARSEIKHEIETRESPNMEESLSSWELYVINDLAFQIALKSCSSVNRPLVRSLQEYIKNIIRAAPQKQSQHEHFLSTYTNLLECFDYLDSHSRNPGKQFESDHFKHELDQVDARGKQLKTQDDAQPSSQGLWKWIERTAGHIFSTLLWNRLKVIPESQKPSDQQSKSFSEARMGLTKLLHEVFRVAQSSCPADMMPGVPFSRKVIVEVMALATQDSYSLVRASEKYFQQGDLIQQIHTCLKSL